MKIKFEDATAGELRLYLKEVYNVDRPPTSNKKSLLNTLNDLGEKRMDFELKGNPAGSDEGYRDPTDAELDAEAKTALSPEMLIESYMAMGMPEQEARELAGDTVNARIARMVRTSGEMPYGPGKEHLYVTVNVAPAEGKLGNEPVPLSVNGQVINIPRGVDFPIRTPYLECLMHAEQIVYDEIMRRDQNGNPTVEHRPRKTPAYPISLITPVPYGRAEAEIVAEQAQKVLIGAAA